MNTGESFGSIIDIEYRKLQHKSPKMGLVERNGSNFTWTIWLVGSM